MYTCAFLLALESLVRESYFYSLLLRSISSFHAVSVGAAELASLENTQLVMSKWCAASRCRVDRVDCDGLNGAGMSYVQSFHYI